MKYIHNSLLMREPLMYDAVLEVLCDTRSSSSMHCRILLQKHAATAQEVVLTDLCDATKLETQIKKEKAVASCPWTIHL
jgi:hypothetical protein